MLGSILEGGLGQYVAPDPSVPSTEDESSSLMQIIAPDPNYYAKQDVVTTPRKSPTPMKICTPSRTSILSNKKVSHTPTILRSSPPSLKEAVLLAAEDTARLLSSPTPIWSRSNDLFTLCSIKRPLSEKQQNRLKKALNNTPSLCQSRSCSACVPDGYTLLHASAASNNIIAAEILLNMNQKEDEEERQLVSVLTPDLQGRTALHIACKHGNKEMIQLLTEHLTKELGALPIGENAPVDLIGYTPLACALTSMSNTNKHKKEIRNELFSPGDKSIFPKSSTKPRSSMKTDNVKYGYSTISGWRVYNEDSICCATNLDDTMCLAFFAVFDGHSDDGIVSDYLSSNVVTQFLKLRADDDGDDSIQGIEHTLIQTCGELESQLLNGTIMPVKGCGSTGIMSVILKDHVIVGNIGDSRGIIIQEHITDDGVKVKQPSVVEVSKDHKPNLPSEKERIEKAGLEVVVQEDLNIYKIQKDNQKIAFSRSFGDFDFKSNPDISSLNQQAVIALPDVYIHPRSAKDAFLLLASDGVWDVMSNEEVASFVLKQFDDLGDDLAKVGDELIKECFERKSEDNMSVVIVSLKLNDGDGGVDEISDMVKRLDF